MQKRLATVALSFLLLCLSSVVSQAQTRTVSDEEKAPTYEIGGQIFSFSGGDDLGFG